MWTPRCRSPLSVSVCVTVCLCVSLSLLLYASVYLCLCYCMPLCISVSVSVAVCLCVSLSVLLYASVYLCLCCCMPVCVCVCRIPLIVYYSRSVLTYCPVSQSSIRRWFVILFCWTPSSCSRMTYVSSSQLHLLSLSCVYAVADPGKLNSVNFGPLNG